MKITKKLIVALTVILAFSIPGTIVSAQSKSNVKKPHDLASQGKVKNVDEIVESIEKVIQKTNISEMSFDANKEIYVGQNSAPKVVKCHFDSDETVPRCEELDKLMKSVGYSDYNLDVYYDNPEAGEKAINDGPICIKGTIEYISYTYYFYNNTLIRRIGKNIKSDNIKTNDFLNRMYKIFWKYQEIENPEYYSVTEKAWVSKDKPLKTSKTLLKCLNHDYNFLKKVLGPNKDYNAIKASLKTDPFWYYFLTYGKSDFFMYADNDKVGALFSPAGELWELPKDGMNVNELIYRTNAEINSVYLQECNGDIYIGEEGDVVADLVIDDNLFSVIVKNGRIWNDSEVMVWPIVEID